MIFIHLLSLILISAFVQAQNLPLGVAVNIMDFQGNVFDLANTSPLDLAPVGTLNHKVGISAQEVRFNLLCLIPSFTLRLQWRITGAAPKFTVINLGATSFLSFTTAVSGVNPIVTQICGHPNQQTLWNITPSADGLGFKSVNHPYFAFPFH
ncbi:hypothetical protein DFH08DRAFT_816123 [Mycena albidolilacea]|uniref:Uncharacterized protein n=1 Tax=Mycena albidolilacea TaxID=1033008 RepID=A0AAD6ZKX0_9AGAR|nr:hypothetical protein DFH08DRAFT_816123 [Mycena albidolilacea]